ncbi:unnamed protein product, partial [Brassica napus]
MIEEEGLLDDGERDRGMPRGYYVLAFIVGFFILFGLFSLILCRLLNLETEDSCQEYNIRDAQDPSWSRCWWCRNRHDHHERDSECFD